MRRGWAGWGLFGVLCLVGVNAVYGGIGLIVNGMGMPDDWLERTPFDSWLLPGIALLVTVALPQFAAAWVVLRRDLAGSAWSASWSGPRWSSGSSSSSPCCSATSSCSR